MDCSSLIILEIIGDVCLGGYDYLTGICYRYYSTREDAESSDCNAHTYEIGGRALETMPDTQGVSTFLTLE